MRRSVYSQSEYEALQTRLAYHRALLKYDDLLTQSEIDFSNRCIHDISTALESCGDGWFTKMVHARRAQQSGEALALAQLYDTLKALPEEDEKRTKYSHIIQPSPGRHG